MDVITRLCLSGIVLGLILLTVMLANLADKLLDDSQGCWISRTPPRPHLKYVALVFYALMAMCGGLALLLTLLLLNV